MQQALYQQNDKVTAILRSLPDTPGVYKYYDDSGTIIYVGKAKNLKKRISSYFRKQHDNARLRLLVKRIFRFETINVDSEYDALILENTLIKEHRPRYNIRLKDDKTYPWICVSNEAFPRIFVSRLPDHNKCICYGPYPSHRMMYAVLDIVKKTFPLRTCKLTLSENNIKAKKFRVCLEYHIGNCLGPCEGKVDEVKYLKMIALAKELIKGNLNSVIKELKAEMKLQSADLKFEEAQKSKEKIELLENYQSKSILVHPSLKSCDVVSIVEDLNNNFVCNYMRVFNGAVIRSHSFEINKQLDESIEEIFDHTLLEVRTLLNDFNKEVIVPFYPSTSFPEIKFTIPKTGHKKELLVLSEKNARIYLLEKKKRNLDNFEEKRKNSVVEILRRDLRMELPPLHIEAFDNSNLQGDHAVAACVVFKNGKPSPSFYRHFNIKSVSGPDDYASMTEVVSRRYKRMLEENQPLPQLILIDGGKGQLESAAKSLRELGLIEKIKLISIAKKLETVFEYGDNTPLYIDKKSPSLRLLQQIRDEVHRFGITHHRNKRDKSLIKTTLTEIKGIGPGTAEKLLRHFGSVENVKNSEFKAIEAVIGSVKAILVVNALGEMIG